MATRSVKITDGGKLVIPAQFRREMGIRSGDTVVVEMIRRELRIRSLASAIMKARAIVRGHVPEKISLADELIAERWAAANVE